jgi:hypothetical protein
MIKFSDLKPEQVREIIEAFAERDTFEGARYECNSCDMPEYIEYFYNRESSCRACGAKVNPMRLDYPNCKKAMGRIIVGMDSMTLSRYVKSLIRQFLPSGQHAGNYRPEEQAHQATPHQQFVAAAMALNLVKEGK